MKKMRNNERIIYGILLTAIVFILANFSGRLLQFNNEFIPYSFATHSVMLILSIALIYGFRKYVNYKISVPKFKKAIKSILFGLLAAVIVNPIMFVIGNIIGVNSESHVAFDVMSPFQFFLFVFIYASVAEEFLFRGFLQNILNPLKNKGMKVFKRHISLPVIIGAVTFSLAHLVLIASGAGTFFLIRTLIFTFILGLIAGYNQEKHNNNAYAILVHIGGNLMGLIAISIMN